MIGSYIIIICICSGCHPKPTFPYLTCLQPPTQIRNYHANHNIREYYKPNIHIQPPSWIIVTGSCSSLDNLKEKSTDAMISNTILTELLGMWTPMTIIEEKNTIQLITMQIIEIKPQCKWCRQGKGQWFLLHSHCSHQQRTLRRGIWASTGKGKIHNIKRCWRKYITIITMQIMIMATMIMTKPSRSYPRRRWAGLQRKPTARMFLVTHVLIMFTHVLW